MKREKVIRTRICPWDDESLQGRSRLSAPRELEGVGRLLGASRNVHNARLNIYVL